MSWLVLAWCSAQAQGQGQATGQFLVHPNHQRGLTAQTAYEVNFLDNVNLFNGNLTLTLPMGQSYPVSESFSWGLTLAYNSQLWDWESMATFCDRDGDGPGQPEPGQWSFAEPGHDFNAGLGWTLTPGRLYRPHQEPYPESLSYRLVTSDGGMRIFWDELHGGDPIDDALYTRDGSYLRLQEIPPGQNATTGGAGAVGDPPDPPSLSWHTVEFPNGMIYTFDDGGWCRRIEDRKGGGVSITPPYGAGDWVFLDDGGRQTVVQMEAGTGGRFRVARVSLPAFGDPVGTASAVYEFQYSVRTVHRQVVSDSCLNSPTLDLDHLDRILLPDGTAYEFDYPASDDPTDPGGTPDLGGMVQGVNLPSGGRYEWSYDRISFPNPTEPTPPASLVPPFLARTFGVVAKRKYDRLGTAGAGGRALLGEWTYDHLLNIPYSDPHTRYKWEKITVVIDPDLLESYHFFSTREDWTYGLPFTDRVVDPWNPDRLLSWYKVDASRTPPNLFVMPDDVLQAGYVRYVGDQQGQTPSNQRVEQSRTYFYDRLGSTSRDPCDAPLTTADEYHYVEEIQSNFDGLGHYRESRLDAGVVTVPAGGTSPVVQSLSDEDLKVTVTDYSRTPTTYSYDPWTGTTGADHNFSMIPQTAPWVLGVISSQRVQEGGEANTVEYCYESTTGFVTRQRSYASEATSAPRSGSDMIAAYERDAEGNVIAGNFYGGDGTRLAGGAPVRPLPAGDGRLPNRARLPIRSACGEPLRGSGVSRYHGPGDGGSRHRPGHGPTRRRPGFRRGGDALHLRHPGPHHAHRTHGRCGLPIPLRPRHRHLRRLSGSETAGRGCDPAPQQALLRRPGPGGGRGEPAAQTRRRQCLEQEGDRLRRPGEKDLRKWPPAPQHGPGRLQAHRVLLRRPGPPM